MSILAFLKEFFIWCFYVAMLVSVPTLPLYTGVSDGQLFAGLAVALVAVVFANYVRYKKKIQCMVALTWPSRE